MQPSRLFRLLYLNVLCLLAGVAPAAPSMAQEQLVDTPFGKVPRECHLTHPSGTTLSKIPGGVRALHPDGTTKDHVSPAKCRTFDRHLKERRAKAGSPPIANGWFNYAGWLAPQSIGQFTASYTLPQLPADPGPQVIYYYIGVEDLAASEILQPVLSYAQGASGGYSLFAVSCCVEGLSNQSLPVTGMGPGDTVTVSILQSNPSPATYSISGSWQGQGTAVNVVVGSGTYNWPDVALEVYNISQCSQFLTGPFTFSQLYLADVNHNTLTPNWGVTPSGGATACNGMLTVDGQTITIQQNLSSAR